MQKHIPKCTADKDQNLADMTHFQVGLRFCEMKTVNKAHIRQAVWVIRTLQSCGPRGLIIMQVITCCHRQRFTKKINLS